MIRRVNRSFYILALLLIFSITSSCTTGCTEAFEFGSESLSIESLPTSSGIVGSYNGADGGQIANATNTGLRANGEPIILKISGSWSPWEQISSDAELAKAEKCTPCFKKGYIDNCICLPGKRPEPEKLNLNGIPNGTVDCNAKDSKGNYVQDDPNLCTCTSVHGSINDDDVYYAITNLNYKNEIAKPADEQQECKFTGGLGLYLGLFGRDGVTFPKRMYHLYSTEELCDVARNADGKCLDSDGNDITQYVYSSPNNKIFIKDDKAGNNGTDKNSADDEYHAPGEVVKMMIYDQYYYDNYGSYKIEFLSGVMKDGSGGIFEYIVGTFEDFLLGTVGSNSYQSSEAPTPTKVKRQGGILELMYTKIVQDSVFIQIVQISLILYITFFGVGVLSGSINISKKEIMTRTMKIALIMFFTTATSWYWYDQIVVGLFKDGMDGIISLFSGLVDSTVDDSSLVKVSQLGRAQDASNATRFSYVDYVIKKLLSPAVHRKIWGLALGSIFSIVYIPAIYALIIFFIYVVLFAAIVYVTALIKLVIALAIGPIFIISSLSKYTDDSFKKWLSFLAGRSLEMICLFLVLYSFVIAIDKAFTDILWFKVCKSSLKIGIIKIDIVKLMPLTPGYKRTFIEWIAKFLSLGALIFLLKEIIERIPGFATNLVTIEGISATSSGDSSAIAKGAMSYAKSGAIGAAKTAGAIGAGVAMSTGRALFRATGLNKLKDKIPFRNPVSIARDIKIDNAIKASTAEAKSKGYTGKDLEKFVRDDATKKLVTEGMRDRTQFSVLGIDNKAIANRLNKNFIEDPMKNFVKDKTKELRNQGLYGKELRDKVKDETVNWANNNIYSGSRDVNMYMNKMDDLLKRESQLSVNDAVRNFAGDVDKQNKYLEHLNSEIADRNRQKVDSKKSGLGVGNALNRGSETAKSNTVGRFKALFGMRDNFTPTMAKSKFLEELEKQERQDMYRKKNQEALKNAGAAKKLLSSFGVNIAKDSLSQRISLFDSKGKREAKELNQNTRNAHERAKDKDVKDRLIDKIADINKDYKDNLRKYGYLPDSQGNYKEQSIGNPSKAKLMNDALKQMDTLAKRMTVVGGEGSGMDRALANVGDLKALISEEFKEKSETIKQSLEEQKELVSKIQDDQAKTIEEKTDKIDDLKSKKEELKDEFSKVKSQYFKDLKALESDIEKVNKRKNELTKKEQEDKKQNSKKSNNLQEREMMPNFSDDRDNVSGDRKDNEELKKVKEEADSLQKMLKDLKSKVSQEKSQYEQKISDVNKEINDNNKDLKDSKKSYQKRIDAEINKLDKLLKEDRELQKEVQRSIESAASYQQSLDIAVTKDEKEVMMEFLEGAKQEILSGSVVRGDDYVTNYLRDAKKSADSVALGNEKPIDQFNYEKTEEQKAADAKYVNTPKYDIPQGNSVLSSSPVAGTDSTLSNGEKAEEEARARQEQEKAIERAAIISKIEEEISELRNQLNSATDENERQSIQNAISTLDSKKRDV